MFVGVICSSRFLCDFFTSFPSPPLPLPSYHSHVVTSLSACIHLSSGSKTPVAPC